MISAIQNYNTYTPSFKGINLSKGINAGGEAIKNSIKYLSNRKNLPQKVISTVLNGPEEIKKAKAIVAQHSVAAAGIAASLAQAGVAEMLFR